MLQTQPEVRRCAACGAAAALCVRDWQGAILAGLVSTGTSVQRDFVCQSCGRGFTIRPSTRRLVAGVMIAGPLTLASFGGLIGGMLTLLDGGDPGGLVLGVVFALMAFPVVVWATRPYRTARANPVVSGVTPPPIRFRDAEPLRLCSCGAPSRCVKVTARPLLGIRGVEQDYKCASCGRGFTIDSVAQSLTTFMASLVAGALGAALLTHWQGQGVGAAVFAGAIALLGVGGIAMLIARLISRARHPIVQLARPS